MMKSLAKRVAILVTVLFFTLLSFSGVDAQTRTLKLGTLEPLSGPAAAYGIPAKEGAMMAVDEINEAGGLKIGNERIKIELLISDHAAKGSEAVNIVEKYIERDGINIIVGDLITTCALAWAPVIERYKGKVMALGHPSDPSISRNNPHIFSSKQPVTEYFEGAARFLAKDLKVKKVFMMTVSDDFGGIVARGMKKEFEKNGIIVIMEKLYNAKDTDYYTQLTVAKGLDFDCLFVAGILPAPHFIFKQAKELGIKAKMVVIAGAGEKDSLKRFKCEDLEGTYDLGNPAEPLMRTGLKAAVRIANNYEKKYGKAITPLAIQAYETMRIIAAGLEKAGTIDDISKIMEGLHKLTVNDVNDVMFNIHTPAPGTTDKLFDQNRRINSRVVSAKWENCQMKFMGWIK